MKTYIYNVELDANGTHNGDINYDPAEGQSNAYELLRKMSRDVELDAVLGEDGEELYIDGEGNEIIHE